MPKIKNWSKVSDREGWMAWKHDDKDFAVYVSKKDKLKWHVWKENVRDRKLGKRTFSTREEARKHAVRWMKNHPNP
jgi:hypothetical protein